MLDTIELNTCLLSLLLHLSQFLFLLSQLQVSSFVFIGELVCQGSLDSLHEVMVSGQVKDIRAVFEVLVLVVIFGAIIVVETRDLVFSLWSFCWSKFMSVGVLLHRRPIIIVIVRIHLRYSNMK